MRELRVRVTRRGFRTQVFVVVTTLLDAVDFSAQDVADLYRARWHCELDLRSLKVALGMDVLRCKTPEMIRKELWVYVLAYNVIDPSRDGSGGPARRAWPAPTELHRCRADAQRLCSGFGLS